jgi:ADP-ribose pyrophosphatase YjhB (NUDIX family)
MNSKTQSTDFRREIPDGDTHERDVCATCGFINYVNPKIVTGSIVRHEGKILLCRRAIEPRVGFWTLPAGFMEVGETAEQAAMREAREEANAAIVIDRLLAVYTIPRIAQVQIMYLAHLEDESFSAGPESLEVMLAGWHDIPWDEIAFPSVIWALQQYRSIEGVNDFSPFSNPPFEDGDPKPY